MALIDPTNEIEQQKLIDSILGKVAREESPEGGEKKSIIDLLRDEGLGPQQVIKLLANFANHGETQAIQFNATKMIVEILRKALGDDKEEVPVYQVIIKDTSPPLTEGGLNPILIPRQQIKEETQTNG